jgi:hypothetical protein
MTAAYLVQPSQTDQGLEKGENGMLGMQGYDGRLTLDKSGFWGLAFFVLLKQR